MAQRLARLRQLLTANNISAYVLPRTDEHQSEYLSQRDERVKFISDFSGSNALTVVTQNEALLWTDSRYLLQAQKQLLQSWTVRKMIPGEQKWFQYLAQKSQKNSKIGFDPALVTAQSGVDRINYFSEKGLQFVPIVTNLIDQIWESRPNSIKPQIFLHQEWAGRSIVQKISWVREKIKQKKGNAAIFNDLSEIAWLLNLRSSEIPHNPFFKGVLVVTLSGGRLYLPIDNPSLQSSLICSHLERVGIQLKKYDPQFQPSSLIVKNQLNYKIYSQIKDKNCIEWQGIGLYRAIRNQKQIQGFRRCHLADGIAMTKFWSWRASQNAVTEFEAAYKMDSLRRQQPLNRGLSFDTISAGGPNGAIIHYRPSSQNSSLIHNNMIHLVDSGGQYLDGTTDVTRAFHFGVPTKDEKEAYTRVLMGNLDIERLQWPEGTLKGSHIDVLAKRHLWKKKWDCLHGIGHGVGHFAGVHESPVGITPKNETVFKAGMIVTNQPGYYREGHFGIRIQNMLLVRQKNGYNFFQNLTLCPYDRNLIEIDLLDSQTRQFINSYHSHIWQRLSPHLYDDQKTLNWLSKATAIL